MESLGELEAKVAAWRTAPRENKGSAEREIQKQYAKILDEIAARAVKESGIDEDGLPRELRFSDEEALFVNYGFFSHFVKDAEAVDLPKKEEIEEIAQKNEACRGGDVLFVTDLLNIVDSINLDRRRLLDLEDKIRDKAKRAANIADVEIPKLKKDRHMILVQLHGDIKRSIDSQNWVIWTQLMELCVREKQLRGNIKENREIRTPIEEKKEQTAALNREIWAYSLKNPVYLDAKQRDKLIRYNNRLIKLAITYGAEVHERDLKEGEREREVVRNNASKRGARMSASITQDISLRAFKTQGFFKELAKTKPMMTASSPSIMTAEDIHKAMEIIDERDPLLFYGAGTKRIGRPKIALIPGIGEGKYTNDSGLNLITMPMDYSNEGSVLAKLARAMADYRIEITTLREEGSGVPVSACLEKFKEDEYWKDIDGKPVPNRPKRNSVAELTDAFKNVYQRHICNEALPSRFTGFLRDAVLPDAEYVSLPIHFRGLKRADIDRMLVDITDKEKKGQMAGDSFDMDYEKACLYFMRGVDKKEITNAESLKRAHEIFKRLAEEDKDVEEGRHSARLHYSRAVAAMRMAEDSKTTLEAKKQYNLEALGSFDTFRKLEARGVYYEAATKSMRDLIGRLK